MQEYISKIVLSRVSTFTADQASFDRRDRSSPKRVADGAFRELISCFCLFAILN